MTKTLLLAILLCSSIVYGQNCDLTGNPKSIIETFPFMDECFDDTTTYGFMTLPEDVSITRHYGLKEFLWRSWTQLGSLTDYFVENGISYPYLMDRVVLSCYYRYLNKQPIELDEQLAYYQNIQKLFEQKKDVIENLEDLIRKTPDSELIKYFPVGDTIQVQIFAHYRKFLRHIASGTEAVAVVKEHTQERLLVEVLSVNKFPKLKPSKKSGDVFGADLEDCHLLPPENWVLSK